MLHDATAAACLEAFLVHARALSEFLWRSRQVPKGERAPRADDGLAEDFFPEPAQWRPVAPDERLDSYMRKVGWGVLHVSYRRLRDDAEPWGWDFGWIAVALYAGLVQFCGSAPREALIPSFAESIRAEFVERLGLDSQQAVLRFGALGHSVGTPMLAWWLPR